MAQHTYGSERPFSGITADFSSISRPYMSDLVPYISMQLHVFYLLSNAIDSRFHDFYTDPSITFRFLCTCFVEKIMQRSWNKLFGGMEDGWFF